MIQYLKDKNIASLGRYREAIQSSRDNQNGQKPHFSKGQMHGQEAKLLFFSPMLRSGWRRNISGLAWTAVGSYRRSKTDHVVMVFLKPISREAISFFPLPRGTSRDTKFGQTCSILGTSCNRVLALAWKTSG